MKTNRQQSTEQCKNFQEQMVMLIIENHSPQTIPGLHEHLENCDACRAYYKVLTAVGDKMSADISKPPITPAGILHNSLKYMSIRRLKNRRREHWWDYFIYLLQYRIPVYQAVAGFIVVLFLSVFLLNNNRFDDTHVAPGLTTVSPGENVYASDTLRIERAAIGQNAHEDSILVSFLQNSL
jgi:predicted anti-sigma-YlaC factor YlaD